MTPSDFVSETFSDSPLLYRKWKKPVGQTIPQRLVMAERLRMVEHRSDIDGEINSI
jgi:hypothetical protein